MAWLMLCHLLIIVIIVITMVNCDVDKLRGDWRGFESERTFLRTEIKRLKEEIDKAKVLNSDLTSLKGELEGLKRKSKGILEIETSDAVFKKRSEILTEFEEIKRGAEAELKNEKENLIKKEIEMENLWNDKFFIQSFDFIMKKSLLVPMPKFPSVITKMNSKLFEKRSELIKLEADLIKKMTKKVRTVNEAVLNLEQLFKTLNVIGPMHEQVEMLKLRLSSMKIDQKQKDKLVKAVEVYQNNQKDELILLDKKNRTDSMSKLKNYLDFLLKEDHQWKLRLGRFVNDSETKPELDYMNDVLIETRITTFSRLATEQNTKTSQYTTLIKENENERMKFVKMIRENQIYKFIVKKYARMVENMHKYLVKCGESGDSKNGNSVPDGIIKEAINYLLLKED